MQALEKYYDSLQNIVLRDTNGEPSIFVRHPKVNSSYFSTNSVQLPDTAHPAFICSLNDNVPVADPAILLGKYENCQKSDANLQALYSQPYQTPIYQNMNISTAYFKNKQFTLGSNTDSKYQSVSGMTIADYGFLTLLGTKYILEGKGQPAYGNTTGCVDRRYATNYWNYSNTIYNIGDTIASLGYLYKCIKAHTATLVTDNPPSNPELWEKIAKVGGTPAYLNYQQQATLTGSGPLDWYYLHDPSLEADLIGNTTEFIHGLRFVNNELQVCKYNLIAASRPEIYQYDDDWYAIQPKASAQGYYEFIPILDAGHDVTKTLHISYTASGSTNTLIYKVGRTTVTTASGNKSAKFASNVKVDSALENNVPVILYELGLLPLPDIKSYDSGNVTFYITVTNDSTKNNTIGNDSASATAINYCAYSASWGNSPKFGSLNFQYGINTNGANAGRVSTRSRAREIATTT